MFNFWQQFKNELESQKIDFDFQSLSPQHKANVIVNFLNMHQFRQLTYWQVWEY
jgi:hypothetical protein